ncbi:uncharacterized protein LOC119312469 isoform X2 [Triticum dicoccoides]|uniref:uncharacterized protein LOC119312469 isoform X2 n=1 Tax=Triticum dicoccoides TaxID=85692 RepID=UPI001890EE67|nr:uncharacterized protein LOC119312469 isoform X2 [Triticum dicoccoides]
MDGLFRSSCRCCSSFASPPRSYPLDEMEACASTSRVLLPFPPRAMRPAAAACFGHRRAGAGQRRGVWLAPARASLDSAAVLLDAAVGAGAGAGYSQASYNTSLGLFILSVSGLWSLIKRSIKSKIVQKTSVGEEGQPTAPSLVAGEILSFFTRNSFAVSDRGKVITLPPDYYRCQRRPPTSSSMTMPTGAACLPINDVGNDCTPRRMSSSK